MSEEKIKILKMLEDGKISAKDASDLLEAVESDDIKEPKEVIKMSKDYSKKYLKI